MKAYPSIPGARDAKVPIGSPCVGFTKYDGSNLRWEWTKKNGWWKHGTRERLFGIDEPPYNLAVPIFMETMGPRIKTVVTTEHPGIQNFTVFTELFGPQSFAGSHHAPPDTLKLLDVWIPHLNDFIEPRRFLKLFADDDWCALEVYYGNLNNQLIADVRQKGEVDIFGKVFKLDEGLVCKGTHRGKTWMVKLKTQAYLDRLKSTFGANWERYA